MTCARGRRLMDSSANWNLGLSTFNFGHPTYGPSSPKAHPLLKVNYPKRTMMSHFLTNGLYVVGQFFEAQWNLSLKTTTKTSSNRSLKIAVFLVWGSLTYKHQWNTSEKAVLKQNR